jgi:hypothetical protein
LGLLLGTKTAGLPYTGILVLYFIWVIVRRKGIKVLLGILLLAGVGIILFGGYGFIRNYLVSGNPLYPLDYVLCGKKIFKGVMPITNYQSQWGPGDFNFNKLFFSEGLGTQFILLIAPSTILAPFLALKKREFNFAIILPIILFLTFYYIIPQLWVRFLYPYLAVGTVVGYWMLKELFIKDKLLNGFFVFFVLSSVAELAGHIELVSSLVLAALLFGFLILKNKYQLRFKKHSFLSAMIVLIGILSFGEGKYLNQEYERYITEAPFPEEEALAWKYLNEVTLKEGANIAYVGRPQPFPLYGTKFKNNVFYISVNKNEPFLHAYKDSFYKWSPDYNIKHAVIRRSGNYRGDADYNIWIKNLENKKIDYLFIYALHRIVDFPFEDEWAKYHPQKFQLTYSNKLVHIYKVLCW